MESISYMHSLLDKGLEEAKQLHYALEELDSCIAKEAGNIDKLDTVTSIDALKARLAGEVYRTQQEESSSADTFNNGRLYSGIMGFAAGAVVGSVFKQENPLSKGYALGSKELAKKAHFGTVMMAMKKGGDYQDAEVIAISRLAREASTTEADILSSLRKKGYVLMIPEDFWQILERHKAEITNNNQQIG